MGRGFSVSSFSLKVLQKLSGGAKGKLLADGGLAVGPIRAPQSLVKNLLHAELIEIGSGEAVLISDVGRMFLRRQAVARETKARKEAVAPGRRDAFARQHQKLQTQETGAGKKKERIVKNIGGTPLAWLLQRKDRDGRPFITREQFEAGEQLARDYEYAGLMPRTVSHYDGIPISGKKYFQWAKGDPGYTQLAAKKRVEKAVAFVGPGLADVLIRVCCYHEGLEQAEKSLNWPTRSAKLVLKFALTRLAEHYDPRN